MAKKSGTTQLRRNFGMVNKGGTTWWKRRISMLNAIKSSKLCDQKLIHALSDDCVHCQCDYSRNTLNDNVKLTVHQKKNWLPFHDAVRDLTHRNGPIGTKNHVIINQKKDFSSNLSYQFSVDYLELLHKHGPENGSYS